MGVRTGEEYPPTGVLWGATVALHPLSPVWAARAWLDSDIETLGNDAVVSDERRSEDMVASRQAAVDVALARLVAAGVFDGGAVPVVEIDVEGVDGNSAGLAFALAILDRLTPGELTGGTRVGVTGTIQEDGQVGPVASVAFKAIAMRKAGAELMLVPAGQGQEARAEAGDAMDVVEVATLEEALAALGHRGAELGPLGASSTP